MEDNVKWEDFVKKHKIKVEELPENVKHKIELFEETFSDYEATDDEEENQIRELEAKLMAMDNGILSELQSFVANRKPDAPEPTPQAGDGGQTPPTPTPPQHQASDKPSWAFWM